MQGKLNLNNFRIGATPDPDKLREFLGYHLFDNPDSDLSEDDYDLSIEMPDPRASFTRVSLINRESGASTVADMRWGAPVADQFRSVHLVFHDNAHAVVPGQIERDVGYSPENRAFRVVSPVEVMARAMRESVTTGKSLTKVFTEGSEAAKIAPHGFGRDDDGVNVSGMVGINPISGDSLQYAISSMLNVRLPSNLTHEERSKDIGALSRSMVSGNLSVQLKDYALKLHGSIPRAVIGPYDVRQRVIEVDPAGRPLRTETSYYEAAGGGAKGVKHGQAAIGARREVALPTDARGNVLTPGNLNIEWRKRGKTLEPTGWNEYVSAKTIFPYQQHAEESPTYGSFAEAHVNNMMASLTLIPAAMPFASGASILDTRTYKRIRGFGVLQHKAMTLSNLPGYADLQDADFSNISKISGRKVRAGKGSFRLGSITSPQGEMSIEIPRAARGQRTLGAKLSIPPYYLHQSEGLEFSPFAIEGRTASTQPLAEKLEKQLGIPVVRTAHTMPEMVLDILSESGGSGKGIGVKYGINPISEDLTVNVGRTPIRVQQMTTEVKSMPMAFSQTFGAYSVEDQAALAGRLPGVGKELGNWIRSTYAGAGRTDISQITRQYSALKTGDPNQLNDMEMFGELFDTFVGQKDSLATLKRFGIAHIQKPQWVNADLVSESEMRERKHAQMAMLRKQHPDLGARQLESQWRKSFRFSPDPKRTDMYRAGFRMNEGFVMPLATNIAPELSGWGKMNYRQIMSMYSQFPRTAEVLGLLPTDSTISQYSDPSKKAWANVLRWSAYDQSLRSGMVYSPGRENRAVVTREKAETIYSKLFGENEKEAYQNMSDKDKLLRVKDVYKSVFGDAYDDSMMSFHASSNALLPSPETMLGIDQFDSLTGESTGMSKSWLAAHELAIFNEMREGMSTEQSAASVAKFRSMMDKKLEKEGIHKSVSSYDAPGMTFQRYSGLGFVESGEIYLPERELRRAVGALGVSGEERNDIIGALSGGHSPTDIYNAFLHKGNRAGLESYVAHAHFGGKFTQKAGAMTDSLIAAQRDLARANLPGFALRQPDTSMFHVAPYKVISSWQAAARGINPETVDPFISAGMSSAFSILGIGDEDADPDQVFLSVARTAEGKVIPHQTAEMEAYWSGANQLLNRFGGAMGTTPEHAQELLGMIFGQDADTKHILRDTVGGYLKNQIGGKPAAFRKGLDARRVPKQEYADAMAETGESKFNMGRVYNTMRLLESSNAALGALGDPTFQRNIFAPMASFYQAAIDMELNETNALFNVLNSARYYGEGQLGASLTGGDDDDFAWAKLGHSQISSKSSVGLSTVLRGLGSTPDIRDETLAYLFAPVGEGADTVGAAEKNLATLKYLRQMQEADPEKWGDVSRGDVLLGSRKLPGMPAPGGVSENSIFYNAFEASAVRRTLQSPDPSGKYADIRRRAASYQVSSRGEKLSLLELANKPHIYLTNLMQRYQTGKPANFSVEEMTTALGMFRSVYGDLTPDNLSKMPALPQAMAGFARTLMGTTTWEKALSGKGGDEAKVFQLGQDRAASVYAKAMQARQGKPPLGWANTLSAYMAGKTKYHPMENLVSLNLGYMDLNATDPVTGEPVNPASIVYPFTGPVGVGEAFEAAWKPNIPGTAISAGITGVPETASSPNLKASLNFGKRSRHFEGAGMNISFKPDWTVWDPDEQKFHLVEMKYSDKDLEMATYQVSQNAMGLQTIAQTAEGRAGLLKDIQSDPVYGKLAATEQIAMVEAMKAGDIGAHVVTGVGKGVTRAHSDPKEVDWRSTWSNIEERIGKEILPILGSKEGIEPHARKVIQDYENAGFQMYSARRWLGDSREVAAKAAKGKVKLVNERMDKEEARRISRGGPPEANIPDVAKEMTVRYAFGGGKPKDPQLQRAEAIASVIAANAYGGNLPLEEYISEQTARILGEDYTPGQPTRGGIDRAVADALGALSPDEYDKVFSPLRAQTKRISGMFKAIKSGLNDENLLKTLVAEGAITQEQYDVARKVGFDEQDPYNDQLSKITTIENMLATAGVPTRAQKVEGPIGSAMSAIDSAYVAANRRAAGSQSAFMGAKKGLPAYNYALRQQEYQRSNLIFQNISAMRDIALAQGGVAEAFEGVAGFNVPQSIEEIQAAIGPNITPTQEDRLLKLKGAYDKGIDATGKLQQFEIATRLSDREFKNLDATVDGFRKIDKAMGDLVKTMKESGDSIEKVREAEHQVTLARKEALRTEKAQNLASILGTDSTDAGELRSKALKQMDFIRSRPGSFGAAGEASIGAIGKALDEFNQADVAFTSQEEEIKARRGRGIGGFFRNALSGFGLMYLRSIGSLMLSGTQYGYSEGIEARAKANQAFAGVFGGLSPDLDPERRLAAIQSLYGGSGYRGLRMAQGDLARDQPGIMGILNAGVSSASAFGATAYFLPEIVSSMGGGMAGAAVTGVAGVVGAAVGLGVAAANIYGANRDVVGTSANIASRMMSKGMGTSSRYDMQDQGVLFRGGIAGVADWASYGYMTNPQIQKRTQLIAEMDKQYKAAANAGTPFDPDEFLQSQGVINAAERQLIISSHGIAKGALMSDTIAPEGVYSALAYSTMYKAPLTGSELQDLSLAYNAGLDLPALSTQILSSATGLSGSSLSAQVPGVTSALIGKDNLQLERYMLGAQRISSLGPIAALSPENYGPEQILQQTEEYADIKPKQWDIFSRRYNIALAQQSMGMNVVMPQTPPTTEFDTPNDVYFERSRQLSLDERIVSMQQQVYGAYASAGYGVDELSKISSNLPNTVMDLETLSGKTTAAENLVGAMSFGGWINPEDKGKYLRGYIDNLDKYSGRDLNTLAGAAQFQSGDYALAFSRGMTLGGQQLPFQMLQEEIGQAGGPGAGGPTGLPLFSTTMRWGSPETGNGLWEQEVAQLAFGSDWANMGPKLPSNWRTGEQVGMVEGMVNRIALPFKNPTTGKPMMIGGMQAAQYMLGNLQYEQAMASAGVQMAQANLSSAFTTGVGLSAYSGITNPQTGKPFGFNTGKFSWNVNGESFKSTGGGLWGLEDASRALGYSQQEFNFEMQSKQLEMNSRQFTENMNINRRQSTMQRDWTREDWGYQDNMRSMQWGWQTEDFQEEARFMTGRDRRKAERQMGRETIVHNAEGEQIDKQRNRQEELWKLEDERFDIQRRHHEEQKAHQEEQLRISQKYYEERKKLEEEQIKLQRAMWTEQMNLQKQAIGIQAHYAQKQKEANDIMIAMSILQIDVNTAQKLAQGDFKTFLENMGAKVKEIGQWLANWKPPSGGPYDPDCFLPDTLVTMGDGSQKEIGKIVVGDIVLAFDKDETLTPKPVIDIYTHDYSYHHRMTLVDGTIINVTETHPFYTRTRRDDTPTIHENFVRVRDLRPGDKIVKVNDEIDEVEIASIEIVEADVTVYNLNVSELHTYIAAGAMVHNKKLPDDPNGAIGMDMIVPPNYPNDSFRIAVSSGERVRVEPASVAQNPWNRSTTFSQPSGSNSPQTIILNLHVGNERLERFVIDTVSKNLEA